MANDPLRRGLRTLVQTTFAAAVIALLAAFDAINWNETQTVAVMAVITPLVSFAQNFLEDQAGMPALLKAPASSGTNPVPDPSSTQ